MAYYRVEGGWCFTSGAFVGHVKVMFIRGTDLQPEPPVKRVAMGRNTRGVELASAEDLGKGLLLSWIRQAAMMPFVWGQEAPVRGSAMSGVAFVRRISRLAAESPRDRELPAVLEDLPRQVPDRAQNRSTNGPWRAGRDARFAAMLPFATMAVVYLLPYHATVFVKPPSIASLPAGFVFEAVAVAWALLGARIVWTTRHRFLAGIALVVCSAISTVVIALVPVLIPILMSLG